MKWNKIIWANGRETTLRGLTIDDILSYIDENDPSYKEEFIKNSQKDGKLFSKRTRVFFLLKYFKDYVTEDDLKFIKD